MFPRGLPGLALLLLRFSVAVSLLIQVQEAWTQVSVLLLAGYLAASAALILGVLTPVAALVAVLTLVWGPLHQDYSKAAVLKFLLDAVALSLIGPGAYSVDSQRFARRIINLPDDYSD